MSRAGNGVADLASTVALLERIAADGGVSLPDNRNHGICTDPKILQFTAGPYRYAYFFDGTRVIVICHVFVKPGGKSNKVSKQDLKVAINMFRDYQAAKSAGNLVYDTEDT